MSDKKLDNVAKEYLSFLKAFKIPISYLQQQKLINTGLWKNYEMYF